MIFDQAQRYGVAATIVNALRSNGESFSILEVGANTHANLAAVLVDDQCQFIDREIDESVREDSRFVRGDALDMDFGENQFDVVVSLDVLEHIPNEKRKLFLTEQFRVAKHAVVLAAPFNFPEVQRAEEKCLAYYRETTGTNHRWLEEHKLEGLPNFAETLRLARELASDRVVEFSHGDLSVWQDLIAAHACESFDTALADEFLLVNALYESTLCDQDYCNRGYRNFLVLLKNPSKQSQLDSLQNFVIEKSQVGLDATVKTLVAVHAAQMNRSFMDRRAARESDQKALSEINLLQNQVLQKEAAIAHLEAQADQLLNEQDALSLILNETVQEKEPAALKLADQSVELNRSGEELLRLNEEAMRLNEELQELSNTKSELESEYALALKAVHSLQNSASWRLSAPVRLVSRLLKRDWAAIAAAWSRQRQ